MPSKWTYVERDQKLVCGEREIRLRPKAGAVLSCLLRRKGRLVTHREILAEVWGGIEVSPDLVREYVFDLRGALGDDPRNPRFIETVRGCGVRLIGEIGFGGPALHMRRATLHVDPPAPSDPAASEQVGDVKDSLTFHLAGMRDIVLLDDAGGTDEADYTLRTRVARRRNGDLEASFSLVDQSTRATLWAERFRSCGRQRSEACDEVAAMVSNAIGSWRGVIMQAEAAKARKVPAPARDAYHHYVLALAHERQRNPAATTQAVRHLERSLELEPENPRGWLLLWYMVERPFILFGEPFTEEGRSRCEHALQQAYALAPDDPHILINICSERAREGDLSGAGIALQRASGLGRMDADVMSRCANAYAYIVGNADCARECLARAHSLNPTLENWLRFTTVRVRFFAGDFAAARAATPSQPDLLPDAIFRALSFAMEGCETAARAERMWMQSKFPTADLHEYANRLPLAAQAASDLYLEAVRRFQGTCR